MPTYVKLQLTDLVFCLAFRTLAGQAFEFRQGAEEENKEERSKAEALLSSFVDHGEQFVLLLFKSCQ